MTLPVILYALLGLLLVLAALRVITAKNPVHAALFLVLCFVLAGGQWLLLQAELLAITLILVYVGAVMVLFLFVIMMLDVHREKLRENFRNLWSLGLVLSVAVVTMVLGLLLSAGWPPARGLAQANAKGNTHAIGVMMYNDYFFAVELASLILLVAMLAAVVLTLRRREGVKRLDPAVQVQVRKDDRLVMVRKNAQDWQEPQ